MPEKAYSSQSGWSSKLTVSASPSKSFALKEPENETFALPVKANSPLKEGKLFFGVVGEPSELVSEPPPQPATLRQPMLRMHSFSFFS
ncbi:hypothetical protein [Pseudoalteromonas sp. T1lg23B]|uniref:hypothetical protein n=1 Tax=Pseudoalteromonas sp. T1lg23B TaxID=2077097 RepID=UPI000CF5DC4E|nr:hypothetical protein [Pseudoalteromonas sp. T1lg23B]